MEEKSVPRPGEVELEGLELFEALDWHWQLQCTYRLPFFELWEEIEWKTW